MTLARFFHPKVIHAAPFGILRNENIDRTEINRASQSRFYGSDAIVGGINTFTTHDD